MFYPSTALAFEAFIPHGHCYFWYPPLVWLHLLSDGFIGGAYYSIPIALFYFVRRRNDLPYAWVFLLFATFIISCGTTHLMEVWTLWYPDYWLSGVIKAITALISVFTAIALFFMIPKALALPSPAQLEAANRDLQNEIAERKRIENELRHSEARYRAIIEDQTEVISRFQKDGKITFVNDAYCRYFGVERQEIIGSHYHPIIHPEDLPDVEATVAQLNRDTPVLTVEHRVQVQSQIRWMQWNNRAIYDENGEFLEYQSVGRDITERKHAEQAIEERERLLRAMFDRSFHLISLLSPDGTLLKINRTALDFANLKLRDVEHRKLWEILPPQMSSESRSQLQAAIARAAAGKLVRQEFEVSVLKPTSTSIALDVSFKPVFDERHNVQLLIAEGRDITERRQKARVEADLRQKEVLLKEIHHRVKNNLQVICSLLNMQARSLDDPQAIAQIQESQNRVRSMALIHEKLYQSDSHAQFQFSDYIRDLAARLFRSYNATATDISLELNIDENCVLNFEIAIPCGLILNELLSNALKYAFAQRQRGHIQVGACLEDDGSQTFFVCDDGIGLPEDFQVKSPKSLGWSLVTGLANQLRATLDIHRENGTSVFLRLPPTATPVSI